MVGPQNLQGSRTGNGQEAVGGPYCASSHGDWQAKDLLRLQAGQGGRGSGYVCQGIQRPHLVEVGLLR